MRRAAVFFCSLCHAAAAANVTLLWRFAAPISTPPVVAGGAVYVGAGPELVALSARSGRVRWRRAAPAGGRVRAAPAVARDGETVYATADDGY